MTLSVLQHIYLTDLSGDEVPDLDEPIHGARDQVLAIRGEACALHMRPSTELRVRIQTLSKDSLLLLLLLFAMTKINKNASSSASSVACKPGPLGNQARNDVRQPWGGARFSTTLHSEVVWADRRHLGPRKARASNTCSSIWTQVIKVQPQTKDKSPRGSKAITCSQNVPTVFTWLCVP